MGHELKPRSGSLPSAAEIARRLATEFAYVTVDEADGIKQARAKADWIERAPARIFLGWHQEALAGAARLRGLASGEALTIEFGDDPVKVKRIMVIPGHPINFGYASEDDEAASNAIVERCPHALDCEILLF